MRKILVLIILFTAAVVAQGGGFALEYVESNSTYVVCENTSSLVMGTGDITVEFWCNISNSGAAYLVHQGAKGTGSAGYAIFIAGSGEVWSRLANGSARQDVKGSIDVEDGNWHHVAVVWDRDAYTSIYVDGVLDIATATSYSGTDIQGSDDVFFGDKQSGSTQGLTGTMDEIRIWNTALSQSTIQYWMNRPIDSNHDYYSNETSDNLKAYYQMSDGSGTSLTDNSANSNIGTLTNMDDDDWVTSNAPIGCTISGDDGFRMMSSPVAGQVYSDLLSELWTQGMTGADVTSGDNNVWTYSGSGWTNVTDISGSGTSLTAGQGFLVYVYTDTDNDGDDDLPVTLSVAGTENSGNVTVPSSGSIADDAWAFAGNPYASTIGWDDVTQTAVTTSAYVWDSQAGTPAYISWNGLAGSLTNGLIAPYQGFWIQGDGGSGSITIAEADKSSTAGTFYKTMNDSTGSMSFSISSGDYSDQTYVSFMNNGQEGIDNSDAYKLLPMSPSERVVGISYAEGNGLDINNLPYVSESSIDIPFDVMYLTLDENYNFVTQSEDVNMNWDLSSLPETIIGLTLTNNTTGETTDLLQTEEVTFTTQSKGSFPAYGSNGVNIYPEVGESQFTLAVAYSALSSGGESTLPKGFALHQAYPNPFNPSTTIRFDLPEEGFITMSVYDITGKLVETLINKPMEPGTHRIQWNPFNLSSGLYIVQLEAGEKTFNQKITFIK